MYRLLGALGLLLASFLPPLIADEPIPPASKQQVDWSEVARWGDRVVVSGTGAQQSVDSMMFTMAMAPPEDDSDMWYITVWGMKGCVGCKALVKGFEENDNLTPFVAVPPGKKKAWAHFNYYQLEDPTQKFRFKEFKVDGGPFPIVTIQPPRNKMFGDPRVVVDRIEARDCVQPANLKKRIIKSVDLWCKKLQQSGYQPPIEMLDHYGFHSKGYGYEQTGPVAADKSIDKIGGPWGPDPPQPVPFNPQFPFGPNVNPAAPPAVTPNFPSESTGFLDSLLSGQSATFFLLIIAALRLWESIGPLFGSNPGTAKMLRELLEKLTPQPAVIQQSASTLGPVQHAMTYPYLLPDGTVLLADGRIVGPAPSPK